jgi:hypothetical protein
MVKGNMTKGQTMIYKTLYRKQKITKNEPPLKIGSELGVFRKDKQFLLH